VLPEDDGGFTLWLRDYLQQVDFYRHLPDLAAREPHVLRLSLAGDDAELIRMLFGTDSPTASQVEPAPESEIAAS
jgi:hypothetical protein